MKKISTTSLISYVLFALSALILTACIFFVMNIKVLENWQLLLPSDTSDIHVGDTVVVQSVYNKLRSVSGESTRYIECKNRSGIWVRYELNRATSDRAAGHNATGIPLTIRRDVADVPTTCKFTIAIKYNVLPFKETPEVNSTKEFTLQGERTTPVSDEAEPQTTTQGNLSQPLTDTPGESSSPSSTPKQQPSQQENVQPKEDPSLLDEITNVILAPLKGIL